MADKDEPADGLFEMQAEIAKRAIQQRNRALDEARELRRQIAESPSLVTELQDRVTSLESECARLRKMIAGGSNADS